MGNLISSSKPTVWYYLLAFSFPVFFLLTDDWRELIFGKWEKQTAAYLLNIAGLFFFFGIPFLLILLRREVLVFEDRVEVKLPVLAKTMVLKFSDLIFWREDEVYIPKAGNQTNLRLKFARKSFSFNRIQLSNYEKLIAFLEKYHPDKNRNRSKATSQSN